MRLTETYFTESNDFIYPVLTDFFWTSVFLILFFYAVHKLLIARFMPQNKKAIFQNSPVSADVLVQEKAYEIPEAKSHGLPVRILSIFLLIVFVWIIASGFYTNWSYWLY